MQKTVSYTAIGDGGIDIYPKMGKHFPGGMALNSAYHAANGGARASIISAIGTDRQAGVISEFCDTNTISREMLSVIDGVTDSVEINLDQNGVPRYSNWNLGVLEEFRLNKTHEQFLRNQNAAIAVYLPELKHLFNAFSSMHLPNTLKVGDFTDLSEHNGDQYILRSYKNCFDIIALSIDDRVDERLESFLSFISTYNKVGIALLGAQGSVVMSKGKQYMCEAQSVPVVDTTGAGDAYLSTFIVSYLNKITTQKAMQKATSHASRVIGHYGGTIDG